jgi:mono/diheme cytochrome c family protein
MGLMALISKRNIGALALFAALGLAAFWVITTPRVIPAEELTAHTADLGNGERIYHASGCHSCHLPDKASSIDQALPVGGRAFKTPIGTLYPINLTPDATGLGDWTEAQFITALQNGVGRKGENLIPAFPYTSYSKMNENDVRDLWAYLKTLPATKNEVPEHEVVGLPIVRRGLTFWKWIGFNDAPFVADKNQNENWNRGAYLVNGPGHCNECHTPRTLFMTSDLGKFLAGGPHPDGEGRVPSLRDLIGRGRYKDVKDLASALEFGEVMGYDKMSSGGMGAVQTNMSKLPALDREAIAEYLTSLK